MVSQKRKLTIAFLKSHKTDFTERDYNKLWKMVWRNIREENPSMRLTKGGYQFLKNSLEVVRLIFIRSEKLKEFFLNLSNIFSMFEFLTTEFTSLYSL